MVKALAYLSCLVLAALFAACGGDGSLVQPTSTPGTPEPEVTEPQASVQPESGPPGTEVTITGLGWEPGSIIDITGSLPDGAGGDPYESVMTDAEGRFSVSFRLEATPEGADLETGRFDLIVKSATAQVQAPFLVETRHPPTGGGAGS